MICSKHRDVYVRTRRARVSLLVALVGAGLFLFVGHGFGSPVWAAGAHVVNSIADTQDAEVGDGLCLDDDGKCTLRAALEELSASGISGSTNTISFEENISGTIVLTSALPDIGSSFAGFDLDIVGPGADALTIDGSQTYRPFFIDSFPSSVAISHLTIANGLAGDLTIIDCSAISGPLDEQLGGAIFNLAALYLDKVVLEDNIADLHGGSIFNAGTLEMTNVDILGNSAGCDGGGIFNAIDGDVTLTDSLVFENSAYGYGGGIYGEGGLDYSGLVDISYSTIAGNSAAGDGGGLFNLDSAFDLTNSTVSGNYAGGSGGGIANWYGSYGVRTRVASSTITDNEADGTGGGIVNGYGATFADALFEIKNSIVAGNRNGDGLAPDCSTEPFFTFVSDHTLVGNNQGCEASFVDGVDGNLVGDSASPIDPLLGQLAANGGAAPTHALLSLAPGSPARDAGNSIGCTAISGELLATDQRGAPRSRAAQAGGTDRCDMGAYETGLSNDSWPRALRLDLTDTGTDLTAAWSQILDKPGQSLWYKFRVSPGSTVEVKLANLAANYDITVYKDIQAIHDKLTTPEDTTDLVKLTAEFAPDAYAPDAYAPDAYAPDAYAPDAYAPDAYAPDAYAPDAYAPDAYAPDAYAPDAYAPDAYAPDAYAPDAYAPDAYAPDAYAPDAYAPDLAYTSAQIRGVVAVSAFGGLADETVRINTWDNGGDYYIRVRGRNGAFNPVTAFNLQVNQTVGVCQDIASTLPPSSLTPIAGDYRTLILFDRTRMDPTDPLLDTLEDNLTTFAQRPEIGGALIAVGNDEAVAETNREADEFTACPTAKNRVAEAIKRIVDGYWALNPGLEYIVIIGNDDVIPFFRHPDRAQLANEKNYQPPVNNKTTSFANLILGYVLGQDAYGASINLSVSNTTLPVPNLAVGRLVETPADIINMLDAYDATVVTGTPGVAPVPQSAFVTGYDFLEDAALAIQAELDAGIGKAADSLITPRELSPLSNDPRVWTADDLRNSLFAKRHDLLFLAGHFSAHSALAADYSTRLLTSEVVSSQVDLQNALIFSAGCHSGYNIVNQHGIQNVTKEPDWAQAFARKGATLIAGTGYQYGDTDFLKYGEQLYLNFSQELLVGDGPVPIGRALVLAKQRYLADTAELRGIHEKSVLQATLYGLPMLSINMPNGRNTPINAASSIAGAPVATSKDPGTTLGLRVSDVTIPFDLEQKKRTLSSVTSEETIDVVYLSGSGGLTSNPAEPVLPLELHNVSVPATVLRGVGFRGGAYTDLPGVSPLTGAAATEIRGVHPPFLSEVFFPVQPWRINYFGLLAEPGGGDTRLAITPGQFISDGPSSPTGIMRTWDSMSFRLYYSDNTTTFAGGSTPAMAAAPAITKIGATTETNDEVAFAVSVVGDPSAGVQEVWVTYTVCNGDNCDGVWQTLDLSQRVDDSTAWERTLQLNGTSANDIRYIVQAVNGVGLVTLATNLGHYYRPGIDPGDLTAGRNSATPLRETMVTFQAAPSSGLYSAETTFSAQLTDDDGPVAGQSIGFALGSQRRMATTDANGIAGVDIPLLGTPGESEVRVTFAGNETHQASDTNTKFTIAKQPTQLTLSTKDTVLGEGTDSALTVTLVDAGGARMREKTVFVIVSGAGGDYVFSEITDLVGEVHLGSVPLPIGDYSVSAYYGGLIPLPGQPLQLSDVNYESSSTSGTLTITAGVCRTCLFLPHISR